MNFAGSTCFFNRSVSCTSTYSSIHMYIMRYDNDSQPVLKKHMNSIHISFINLLNLPALGFLGIESTNPFTKKRTVLSSFAC